MRLSPLKGWGVVTTPKFKKATLKPAITASLTYYQQRGRLLAAAISTRGLSSCKCHNQAITEMTSGLFKCTSHSEDGIFSYQNVALAGIVFANMSSCP